MNHLNETFTLTGGVEIPCVGYGTFRTPNDETAVNSVAEAIRQGYRHIDAAAIYNNEASVGEGIRQSGVPREELFVTGKVWNTDRGYGRTLAAFEKSLSDLQLDYLDLYLIHWPANVLQYKHWRELNAETWEALETLLDQGRVRAIGVSNFLPHHLEALMETAKVAPMVNQIEFHPGYMQQETLDYCKNYHIQVEAYSPLGNGKMLSDETLGRIAGSHGRSVAQVCLRWAIQHDVLPLPKSVTPERIRQNAEIFDFELTPEEMAVIDGLPYIGGTGHHPDSVTF